MKDSEVTDLIYSIGLGVAKLPKFARALSDRKGKLFRPQGKSQEITKSLREMDSLDQQLQAALGNADEYRRLVSRQDGISQELDDAYAKLSRLNTHRSKIESLQRGWDDWLALTDCETRLKDIPRFQQFPESPIARLESLEGRKRQVNDDLEDASEKVRSAEAVASAVIPGENLLDDAGNIEQIRRARSSFDNSVRDLPERQTELRGLRADFDRNLRELGHSWGETELEAFDTSMVVRNEVEQWKQRMDKIVDRSQKTRLRLEQDRLTLQDNQTAVQKAREKLPTEPPPLDAATLRERLDGLRVVTGRLNEYERERQNLENLRRQLGVLPSSLESPEGISGRPNFAILILLGLAGIALIVAGILFGEGALILGSIGGLALLTTAVGLFFFGKPSPSVAPSPMATALGQQAAEAEAAVDKARRLLLKASDSLGLADQPNAVALGIVEADLNSAREVLDIWTDATARVEETSR